MKLIKSKLAYRAKLIANTYNGWLDNERVLDVGCGNGIVIKKLNNIYHFKRIAGCDIDEYLLANIEFKKMRTPTKLPFKKAEFDVVMFNDVLHHTDYENQISLITESLRVASAALLFELKPSFIDKIGDYLLNKFHNPNMNIPFTYRSQKEWERLFSKNRIKFEKRQVYTPFWYPFTHIAYRLTK